MIDASTRSRFVAQVAKELLLKRDGQFDGREVTWAAARAKELADAVGLVDEAGEQLAAIMGIVAGFFEEGSTVVDAVQALDHAYEQEKADAYNYKANSDAIWRRVHMVLDEAGVERLDDGEARIRSLRAVLNRVNAELAVATAARPAEPAVPINVEVALRNDGDPARVARYVAGELADLNRLKRAGFSWGKGGETMGAGGNTPDVGGGAGEPPHKSSEPGNGAAVVNFSDAPAASTPNKYTSSCCPEAKNLANAVAGYDATFDEVVRALGGRNEHIVELAKRVAAEAKRLHTIVEEARKETREAHARAQASEEREGERVQRANDAMIAKAKAEARVAKLEKEIAEDVAYYATLVPNLQARVAALEAQLSRRDERERTLCVDAAKAERDACEKICDTLIREYAESGRYAIAGVAEEARDRITARSGETTSTPVCATCRDTHRMTLDEREVPCTFCPRPCEACRALATSAYCGAKPCRCACHAPAAAAAAPPNVTAPAAPRSNA